MRVYRNRVFYYFVLFGLSFLGCRKSDSILSDLTTPNWQNGDKCYYQIYHNNQLIGYAREILHFDMEGNEPTYVLEILKEIDWQETYLIDSTAVCFSRKDFSPIWSYRRVETDFDSRIVEAHYDESDIDIWTETMDGKDAKSISVKGKYFDNEMIFNLIRCVRFEKGRRYSIKTVNPFLIQVAFGTIKFGGKATVKSVSGTFDCNKINLTFDSAKYLVFVERSDRRRIVQIQEKSSDLTMVLIEKAGAPAKITSR
ncbi:MAG: hypothetical protein ABIK61_06485 [candidate division WOR-3 bacterium]